MKATGQITIEGIEKPLNNPSLEIRNISYPQGTNTIVLECIFKEEGANIQHQKNYTFENESISTENQTADAEILLKTVAELTGF